MRPPPDDRGEKVSISYSESAASGSAPLSVTNSVTYAKVNSAVTEAVQAAHKPALSPVQVKPSLLPQKIRS